MEPPTETKTESQEKSQQNPILWLKWILSEVQSNIQIAENMSSSDTGKKMLFENC